jgi:hypothetical protein
MALDMAGLFGLPTDHLSADTQGGAGSSTARPRDAHLDTEALAAALGEPLPHTPFREGIARSLRGFAAERGIAISL